jgi:Tfp pilus assembly protein PilX
MRRRQQGVTLILSLIMLVLLTIMALSAFNIGKGSLQVVDNAQQQSQALSAAQAMIDQVVSTPSFVDDPDSALDNSNCPVEMAAPANSRCLDLYGDGKTVILVRLTPQPTCTQVKPVLNSDLDLVNPEDLGCSKQEGQNHGIEGLATDESLCSDSMWEINALATEQVSRAQARVTQGVSMRVSNDAVETACP